MAVPPQPWGLTIASDLRLLALARAFVEGACRFAGLDEAAVNGIVLAADEATNNVIRHAHHDRPDALLHLECVFAADRFEVLLHDVGDPFDIDAVPRLDPGELRVGGRGVFLMRAIMDELTCERRGPSGNTLRMLKRLPAKRPSGGP